MLLSNRASVLKKKGRLFAVCQKLAPFTAVALQQVYSMAFSSPQNKRAIQFLLSFLSRWSALWARGWGGRYSTKFYTERSNPVPFFFIPFVTERYPFRIPSTKKRTPLTFLLNNTASLLTLAEEMCTENKNT